MLRGLRKKVRGLIIIEGKIQEKISIGSEDLRRWFGCSSIDIFRGAVSRTMLGIWIRFTKFNQKQ